MLSQVFEMRLFLVLFSVLHLVDIVIEISQETASINKNKEKETQDYGKKQKKPHIIIIVADDMGWNDVSFHGSNQIPTPNIDALAYNGVILNNHYVSALCTPSRSALLAGKYPIHLGMQHEVVYVSEPRGLPLNEKLLPQYLKEANYKTHIVGKWHLGYHKRAYTPLYRGFDTHFGYYNGFQDYYNHMVIDPIIESNPPIQGFDMRRNLSIAWDTMGKYSTDLFTEEAVQLINTHDTNNPMFLYLAHLAPHSGNQNNLLQAPAKEIAKFSYITNPARRIYAAMVSKLDHSVGEIIEALNKRKMLENSIVLFLSDNGAPTEGFLQNYGSNYPFRGIKNSPWEGGVRGVAAIWSPLIKKRKRVSNQLMSIVDWLPTLLSAVGISEQNIPKIDGRNMWPTLVSDKHSPRHEVLINIDDIDNYFAIRRGNFKYVNGETSLRFTWVGDSGRSPNENRPPYNPEKVLHSKAGIAIAHTIQRISGWKRLDQIHVNVKRSEKSILTSDKILQLRQQAEVYCNVSEQEKISCDPLISPCLFNIKDDPCEMINIIEQKPLVAASLKKAALKYRITMIPPSNIKVDPRANPKYWNNTWTFWQDTQPLAALNEIIINTYPLFENKFDYC
ncbi:arylsulfatase B [Solenopsis invicta]|uniref:arylsulfatase B n=1 Tax=Solenopsis invicta TaxID=13686 RepID=UPI00193CF9E3|nr:arylsulfatase B [Solenopsis invicta]